MSPPLEPAPPAPMIAPPVMGKKRPVETMDIMMTLAGVGVGALFFTGLLCFQAILLIPAPSSPFGGGTPSPSALAYASLVRTLAWISMTVLDAAAALVVAFAFLASTSRSSVPDSARKGLYIFSTVFLVSWLFLSYFFMSSIASVLRLYGG